jgi:hypothetical protein
MLIIGGIYAAKLSIDSRAHDDDATTAAVAGFEGPATALQPGVITDVGTASATPDPTTQTSGIDVGRQSASDRVAITTGRLAPQSLEALQLASASAASSSSSGGTGSIGPASTRNGMITSHNQSEKVSRDDRKKGLRGIEWVSLGSEGPRKLCIS